MSLRGNENVAVQINGRPTPMRGAQLASYLKSVPANTIERIEVVPNPSAKYDPEGMAGIINVVLKQNVDLGLSAGLNTAISKTDRYFGSGNLGYQAGKVSSFTTVGFNRDTRGIYGLNDRERYDAARALLSISGEDIDSDARNGGQNLNTTFDYAFNKRDVLSNALTVNRRESRDASMNAFAELDGGGALLDSYFRPKRADVDGWMFDYNVAMKRTIEPRKHEISGEVRFNRSQDDDEQNLWRQPNTGSTRIENEHQVTDASSRQLTAQFDYARPLAARTKLESGYKGNARWLDRDFFVEKDSLGTGTWTPSALSNAFEFDESVHAVYGVLSHGVGKFDLQAGLRGEHAERDFSLAGGQAYPYKYNSLFPSANMLYNASAATQLKASYSRRIRRPGTQELNPFVSYFDVRNVFIGNPALAPEYTNAFELGVTRNGKRGMIQLSPFYRQTSDIIRVDINTTDTIAGREVTSVSFTNLQTSNSWGADINGSLRYGTRFNGFASFNVFKHGDGRRLDEQPRVECRELVRSRERQHRAFEDDDAAGLVLLPRADQDRAWPVRGDARRERLHPAEAGWRQGERHAARERSLRHAAFPRTGRRRLRPPDHGAQLRRADGVARIPVQLRTSAAGATGASGAGRRFGVHPAAIAYRACSAVRSACSMRRSGTSQMSATRTYSPSETYRAGKARRIAAM